MTGIVRTSVMMKYEDEFGVESTTRDWFRLPSKLNATFSSQNNTTYGYGIGNRTWETAIAGKFTGNVTLTFTMDYNCISYLGACFDTYQYTDGQHIFSNENARRSRSFTLRFRKLNRLVGGPLDQTTICRGCVCTSFGFKQNSGSATLDCTMSCFYVNEESMFDDLSATDYGEDTTELVPIEWSCMNIDGESVANTLSVGATITNGSASVAGCGTRFDSAYYSGKVNVTISTTVYSKDPARYYRLMYSGGSDDTLTEPKNKGLEGIAKMELKSSMTGGYSCIFEATNVFVDKSGMNAFGESQITDSPSLNAQHARLILTNNRTSLAGVWPA